MKKYLHRHHIIPKHIGGTDDADNIVLLTVEEHAEAHKILYQQFGREEDRIAWLGLAGIIGHEIAVKESQSLGGKKAAEKETNPWRGKQTATNWALDKENQKKASEAARSEIAIKKRKETYKRNKHQQGINNSNFGKSVYRNEAGERKNFIRGLHPDGWVLTEEWYEERKDKKNSAYGKSWYNDGQNNFLLAKDDERVNELTKGRLKPGFKTA